MIDLSRYVFEALRTDEEFILHRGWSSESGSRVLVVSPALQQPAPKSLDRLEHEYSLKEALDPSWAARPITIAHHWDRPVLLLTDPGGIPLSQLPSQPVDLALSLRVGISLSTALSQLHRCGLIHKNIKPANILVDSDTGRCWLTGFGIASRLPRERQAAEPPEVIAGTLAYMAPEQTGRVNRSIDSRSDLYSLGIILYELLTGSLPFAASDPMEWVHCHIARQPVPPSERLTSIPPAVCAIVMKLLAKTAEERYQTAAVVVSDLQRCLSELEFKGCINEFQLGEHDVSDRLLIPEKLYGRTSEIGTLLASFERVVAGGRPELVLVSGYSGIGKSSVVNELHKVLVPPRGLFASGKFDQNKRDIPYATLVQALQSLVRSLLVENEPELQGWREAIQEALDPNAQLIVDLVPELELIIGEQPPVPELPSQDAQRRFHLVFRRFINVFARREHPLALFLDDLQWLDAATLNLLQDLLTEPDVQHLMLVGAYRDNEVNSSHPLIRKLESIRQAGAMVQEIFLAPLALSDLRHLIADALQSEPDRVASLAQLVHEKTAGNPFFAIQFITALAEEGLLIFDHSDGRWSWDLNRIRAKRYTENVADLMAGKLNRLPIETQKAMQEFACLGNRAEIAVLAAVHRTPEEKVHSDLWEAVRLQLIAHLEGSYRFVHDRIQEAAYSLIPAELRAEAHLRIGRLLDAHIPQDKQEEAIFEIVNQFNRSSDLIRSAEERERVAELNLRAGTRAKASTAYVSALSYLEAGRALLKEDSWASTYQLIFSIEILIAECELLTANTVAAEDRLSMLSQRATSARDIATVTRLRLTLYQVMDRSDRAVEVCLEYLRRIGTDWSPHPTRDEVQREYDRIWTRLGNRQIESLIDLPSMTSPDVLDTLEVLTEIVTPAKFWDQKLLSLVICRMVNLSLEHGNSDGSCFAYVWFAIIAGPFFENYKDGFRFGQLGYELVERRGLIRYQARTYMCFGQIVIPWARHVLTGRELIHRAFDIANRTGDLTFVAYCRDELISNFLTVGDPLAEVQRKAEDALEFVQKARFGLVIDIIIGQLAFIRTLRGLTPKFGSFDSAGFDEHQFERRLTSNPVLALPEFWYRVRKTQARFLAGDYASAVHESLRAQQLLWTSPSQFETAEFHFYGALSRAASLERASPEQKGEHFEALAAHHRQLEVWAENCPENFENRAALLGAEIARLEGRELDAERLYERAIRSAHANGFVHNEALANEVAARFYLARGFEKFAHTYLREARYCYLRWEAIGKVRQLDELYPRLREEEPVPGPTSTIGTPVEHLDLATVIKVSQAISGEIVLEKLVDTLMSIAVEHAGAERGLLILPRGDELRAEAEATTNGETIVVRFGAASVAEDKVPESILHYVVRTGESVILDDASVQNPFSSDKYIERQHARSILCLPLIKQARLIGLLYLENKLAPQVFTPKRIAVLKLLASQAAISLENTHLYRELAERETKLRRLVDANIMGIYLWSDQEILDANEALLRIVGYSREDLVSGGLRWPALTPPEWRERDNQARAELEATGTIHPFEKEYLRKDGSRIPVLLGCATFERSTSEGVAFVVDLSEQKRAEEALRRSEAYLTQAQRLSRTGSFWWKVSSEELIWSEELFRVMGYDQTVHPAIELFFQRVHPEDLLTVQQMVSRAVRDGANLGFEHRLLMPDGLVKHVYIVMEAVGLDPENRAFVGTVMDVTARKQAEEAWQKAQAELAHVSRVATMGELTASIAHEINQPLGAIANNAQAGLRFLATGSENLQDVKEALSDILNGADRVNSIIVRMRALAKKAPPEKAQLNFRDVVADVLTLIRHELSRRHVEIELELSRELPPLLADRVQLQQVLLNLIMNGVEAMNQVPEGNRKIWVRAEPYGHNCSPAILVSVRDSGSGLNQIQIDRLFEAFYTTKSQGLGMGLAISRSIVEAHGGRLWAKSNVPRGAVFQFVLPARG